MATSGTVGLTKYPVNKVIEQAIRRCGVATSTINAEMLAVGRDNLFLMLSAWANRGVNLWEVRDAPIVLQEGVVSYDLPVGTVDLLNLVIRSSIGTDVVVSQISRDDYTSLPNKAQKGRPTLYWLDRRSTPRIVVWPAPDALSAGVSLIAWCHRQVEDVGSLPGDLDVPQRWLEAVVTGLAVRMLRELPGADLNRSAMLQADAQSALFDAEAEESDGAPIAITPDITVYTR